MFANGNLVRRSILKGLVALAGAAGIAPAISMAQDCKLSIQAVSQVVYTGQAARIKVYACPSDPNAPNAPYAFASAAFDVLATDPLWSFATDGRIVGSDVLGINVSQPHQPNMGIYADPSNPYPVWTGIVEPQTDKPALVEIAVAPESFSVYPSQWTSSAAECEAEGGNDFIFVNPLSVGRWLAAPGDGTTIEIQDDVVVDGHIITGENWNTASVGIVPTGTVRFFDSSSRIEFDGEPVTFTATVQAEQAGQAQRSRVTSMTVTFDGLENHGGYVGGATLSMADGSVRGVSYNAYLGGVWVASGDFDNDGDGQIPDLIVDSLPQAIGGTHNTGALRNVASYNYSGVSTVLDYDAPIVAIVRDDDGYPQTVRLDRIEVLGTQETTAPDIVPGAGGSSPIIIEGNGIREATARPTSSNNLKQLGLGCHVFEAEGVRGMRVTPSQGE